MKDLLDFVARIGLKTTLFVLLATGISTLALEFFVLMPGLDRPTGWVSIASLLVGWWLIAILVQESVADRQERRKIFGQREAANAELVGKLTLLTDAELLVLTYYKHHGLMDFRAFHNNAAIAALTQMKLLTRHESIDRFHQARFSIPAIVWDNVRISSDQLDQIERMERPPWISRER